MKPVKTTLLPLMGLKAFRLSEEDLVLGETCLACGKAFDLDSRVTLVPLGPGEDEASQQLARSGLSYNAVAIPVHFRCATGFE